MIASSAPDSCALVLRPQTWVRGSLVGSVAAASGWLLASGFYLLKFHGPLRIAMVALDVVVVVGAVAVFRRSHRRTRLTLTNGRLVFSGLVSDRVLFADGRPGRVVEADVDWGLASGRRSRLWLLVDADGRTEVGLNHHVWDQGQLEDLRVRLGLPREVVTQPLRPAEARKVYPGTIPWWAVHPVLATYLLIALIIAIVVGLRSLA